MPSVWDMILQWGSTLKVSIELPVATRHCHDMTEKLLIYTTKNLIRLHRYIHVSWCESLLWTRGFVNFVVLQLIWLWSHWFWRRTCLKMLTDDDGCLLYKFSNSKGSGGLKKSFHAFFFFFRCYFHRLAFLEQLFEDSVSFVTLLNKIIGT